MRRALGSLAVGLLLAAAGTAQAEGLKVYVSVDMEGVSGVVHADQTSPGGHDYGEARCWIVVGGSRSDSPHRTASS